MSRQYFESISIQNENFPASSFAKAEYENCMFRNCNFSHVDLSECIFQSCEFIQCDFSMAKLQNTAFREVVFKSCKQLGLRFDECNKMLLSFTFDSCVLDFSSFYKLKLKGVAFRNCQMHEVDLAEADLTNAIFQGSDLEGAMFDHTILEAADFRNSMFFSIDPEENRIKKARFSQTSLAGLLGKYGIVIE